MKRAERQPLGSSVLYGGVYVKEMLAPDIGTVIPQHSHRYDHISYLAAGQIMVTGGAAGTQGVYTAPAAIRIAAGVKHTFTTMQPMTLILCIHSVALGEADFDEAELVHAEHTLELE